MTYSLQHNQSVVHTLYVKRDSFVVWWPKEFKIQNSKGLKHTGFACTPAVMVEIDVDARAFIISLKRTTQGCESFRR